MLLFYMSFDFIRFQFIDDIVYENEDLNLRDFLFYFCSYFAIFSDVDVMQFSGFNNYRILMHTEQVFSITKTIDINVL